MVSVFRWKQTNPKLATRQLRTMGLRPSGQEPAVRTDCRGGRFAWLYRIDLALPVRPMTLAKEAALDKAMAARTTCPTCLRRYHHALPLRTLGSCLLRTTRFRDMRLSAPERGFPPAADECWKIAEHLDVASRYEDQRCI
ncbi:RRQRL motif-containing zinc-binding protein [Streptomyces sp. NPDC057052]|uniref:RRQRL motif-containing zinc-binding protein n=1 Tax=Streptomyces sp. NPDC057052 TaxID=3346010 RepID=UPI003643914F